MVISPSAFVSTRSYAPRMSRSYLKTATCADVWGVSKLPKSYDNGNPRCVCTRCDNGMF